MILESEFDDFTGFVFKLFERRGIIFHDTRKDLELDVKVLGQVAIFSDKNKESNAIPNYMTAGQSLWKSLTSYYAKENLSEFSRPDIWGIYYFPSTQIRLKDDEV